MEFLLASVAQSPDAVNVSLRPRVAKYLAKVAAGLDLAGLIGILRDAFREGVSRSSAALTSKQIQDIRREDERAVN